MNANPAICRVRNKGEQGQGLGKWHVFFQNPILQLSFGGQGVWIPSETLKKMYTDESCCVYPST